MGHEVSTILSRYRGARNINEAAKKVKEHGRRDSKTGSEEGFKTIVVDLGYRQKVNPSRLMGVINDVMEGTKVRIGKIDMDKTFSRIDVEERYAADIAARLSGSKTGSYTINAYFEEGAKARHNVAAHAADMVDAETDVVAEIAVVVETIAVVADAETTVEDLKAEAVVKTVEDLKAEAAVKIVEALNAVNVAMKAVQADLAVTLETA